MQQEHRVRKAQPELRAQMELTERRVPPARKAHKVWLAQQAHRAHKAQPELQVQMELTERLVQQAV